MHSTNPYRVSRNRQQVDSIWREIIESGAGSTPASYGKLLHVALVKQLKLHPRTARLVTKQYIESVEETSQSKVHQEVHN